MRILLAEDEEALSMVLVKIFEKNGFSVEPVYNGEDALACLEIGCHDVAVLDVMMPKMDGITVLKNARAKGVKTPILMLTAKSQIEDRVLGLDSGANDYLPKPFDARELVARVKSLARSRAESDEKLRVGNVLLDRGSQELTTPTGCFRLSKKEYQMMEYLMMNKGRTISQQRFLEKLWGNDEGTETNVVFVYVSYLRKKLMALSANVQIEDSGEEGYVLEAEEAEKPKKGFFLLGRKGRA